MYCVITGKITLPRGIVFPREIGHILIQRITVFLPVSHMVQAVSVSAYALIAVIDGTKTGFPIPNNRTSVSACTAVAVIVGVTDGCVGGEFSTASFDVTNHSLAPFELLHFKQQGSKFPGVFVPPRDKGITWSTVVAYLPHRWHTLFAARIALRSFM